MFYSLLINFCFLYQMKMTQGYIQIAYLKLSDRSVILQPIIKLSRISLRNSHAVSDFMTFFEDAHG